MKKAVILCLVGIICLFGGCNENNNKSSKIADFSGTWKQVNGGSKDSYQEATISGDTIEIFWMSDNYITRFRRWV